MARERSTYRVPLTENGYALNWRTMSGIAGDAALFAYLDTLADKDGPGARFSCTMLEAFPDDAEALVEVEADPLFHAGFRAWSSGKGPQQLSRGRPIARRRPGDPVPISIRFGQARGVEGQ